ncbi:MAG: hypothetical protein ACJAXU_000775 [Paracoccaceae bacterium]|jgi:hypothetical protein
MIRRLVFALVVFLTPNLVNAGSLAIDWAALKSGQYQSFRTNEGARLISRYSGQQDGLYLFEVYYGLSPIGQPMEKLFLDPDGQFVKSVFENGETKQFIPHDCSRTEGACTFALKLENGDIHNFSQFTKVTKDGFSFVRRSETGKVVMRGRAELNAAGLIRNMATRTPYARRGIIREIKFVP